MARRSWEDAETLISPDISAKGIHKWRFDPAFPIDVLRIALGPRNSVPANRHSYLEFIYVVSGELKIDIEGETCVSHKGDLVIVNRDHLHFVANPTAKRTLFVVLYFEPEILRTSMDSSEEITEYLTPFLIQDSTLRPLVGAKTGVPERARRIIEQIAAELPADCARRRLAVRTYLRLLLLSLVEHFADSAGLREPLDHHERQFDRLKPLFGYLDAHYADKITVEQASDLLYMSPSHFMSFFKKTTGQSFHSHLNRLRIAKARSLLLWTSRTVADIGFETGFATPSHFTESFRRIVGVTPGEYRENASAGTGNGRKHGNSR
ncbi:MAG: AraC family transcriptional regulator [Candidatus Omnitrophica bacterium]|nr:AraC family transcriptional regulator [Candidatus Omnitrophota bacterium]